MNLPGASKPHIQLLAWMDFSSKYVFNISSQSDSTNVRNCGTITCHFTANKLELSSSDAVMFDVRSSEMFSEFNHANIPHRHHTRQYWILYNQESLMKSESFYHSLPGNTYNMTATYRRDSDIHLPYGECHKRAADNFKLPPDFLKNKIGLVVWHVSHCTNRNNRNTYVEQLSKYTYVDVFGGCSGQRLPNDSRPRFTQNMSTAAEENINKYKFYLAFENNHCHDYITEKPFKILQDNIFTVPIVRGLGPYKDILPPGSYINVDDFDSPKDLAEYLIKLDKDDTLYMSYFKSRRDFMCINHSTTNNPFLCRICNAVAEMQSKNLTKTMSRKDITSMFSPTINCLRF